MSVITARQYEEALRDWLGDRVVFRDGWATLTSAGGFDAHGVLHHWTAMSGIHVPASSQERLLAVGRPDLGGPLCHLSPRRSGIVAVIAGPHANANHAGAGDPNVWGRVLAGTFNGSPAPRQDVVDGNERLYGFEYQFHPEDGAMPDEQVEAGILAAAALAEAHGWTPAEAAGSNLDHYEWTSRKTDRRLDGLADLTRKGVREKLTAKTKPTPAPVPPPTPAPTPSAKRRPLRVVHAPLHGVTATPAHLAHALKLAGGGVVGFSECYPPRLQAYLRRRLTWRRFVADTDRVDARGRHVGWDVTLMVRRWRRVLDSGSFKAADEVPASLKIAPERWVVWAVLGPRRSPVLAVAAHPHAVPQPGTARGREYAAELERIEALVEQQRDRWPNLREVVFGDLNHRDVDGPLSPRATLKRLGMRWHTVGLDWLAWSGLRPQHVDTVTDNGQDHPWLVATFTKEKR